MPISCLGLPISTLPLASSRSLISILLPGLAFPVSSSITSFFFSIPDFYLIQVISEGLRLRPIVGNAFKVATENTTLYGYRVPKGWSVNLDYRAVMCRDSYFPEADQFRPERFDVRERNERIGGESNPHLFSICPRLNSVAMTDLCTPLCALFL